jgi:hypothetical protein
MLTTIDHETGEQVELGKLPREISPVLAAELHQGVATAHRYPRRPDSAILDELYGRATLNETVANECVYSLPRDGKTLIGPSVRFAELVRASYGNILVKARFDRIDDQDPLRMAVIIEAAAFDLQANSAESVQVRRSIMTSGKGGSKPRMFSADMVNVTINAGQAIARRNAILAVVPRALWSDAYHGAIKVIRGDLKTLQDRRAIAFETLMKLEVPREEILRVLGVREIEDVNIDHLPSLRGIITALQDGQPVSEVLGRYQTEEAHVRVANPLKDQPRGRCRRLRSAKARSRRRHRKRGPSPSGRPRNRAPPSRPRRNSPQNGQRSPPVSVRKNPLSGSRQSPRPHRRPLRRPGNRIPTMRTTSNS